MWMKMSKSATAICSVVGLLGLIAAILGFAAEANRVRPGEVRMTVSGSCVYPTSSAPTLGITAAFALLLAQVIVNYVAGCICCRRSDSYPPSFNRTIAMICLIVSRITFIIACIFLIAGATTSNEQSAFGNNDYYCKVVKPGVFAGGAILALATMTFSIIYFITASTARNSSQCNPQNHNIAMAQPKQPTGNVDVGEPKV